MSIDGTYDTDNIFAKILRGEMPCVKLFEDDHVLAFMDIFPQSDGHTLVLPKTSARNLLDLDDEALSATMIRVKRLTAAVRLALNPDGIVITQFIGAPAGQTVSHNPAMGKPIAGPPWRRAGGYGCVAGAGRQNQSGS